MFLMLYCPKCNDDSQSDLHGVGWTDGSCADSKSQLLHCMNFNVLLISRIYLCQMNHRVLGHHPHILHQFTRENRQCLVPFTSWHISGFTSVLSEYVESTYGAGTSMTQIEQLLIENRAQVFYYLRDIFTQLQRNTVCSTFSSF